MSTGRRFIIDGVRAVVLDMARGARGRGARSDGRMRFNDALPDPFEDFDPELEAALDETFDLGDGTADTVAEVSCPYCGETNEVAVDPGSGAAQEYVEDCQVCCRPWRVVVSYDATGGAHVLLQTTDD